MACKSCNSFGSNCSCHKTKVGMTCGGRTQSKGSTYNSFGENCHPDRRLKFGVKSQTVKGFGSLTKDKLKTFLQMHGHDLDLSATKDSLFKQIRKIYPTITPVEINQSVNTRTSYESIKIVKDAVKAQEKEAKEQAKLEKIRKVLYTPREIKFEEVISRRLPAGSKVKRLTRPEVKQADIDDLTDMFSAARASPDEMSDLLTKLSVNKFGA